MNGWVEIVAALLGALVGAGLPVVIALLKFAAQWGALVERVADAEEVQADLRNRVRVVEQRTNPDRPAYGPRQRPRTW